MNTVTRYFTIKCPRSDFTGRVGAVSFADGIARVSFDDTRDEHGRVVSDENKVHVGRSAVMFARRRKGYEVIETDIVGTPLTELAEKEATEKATAADEAKAARAKAAADKKAAEEAAKAKADADAKSKGGAQ